MFTGSYAVAGQTVCTRCPPGKACPAVDADTENDCQDGEYSEGMTE